MARKLRPLGALDDGRRSSGDGPDRVKLVLGIAFAGLVAIALAVVFLLPGKVAPPPPAAIPAAANPTIPAVPTGRPADVAATDKARAEALEIQVRLKGEGVDIWGAEKLNTSLAEAEAKLAEATAFYNQNKFTEALAVFHDAVALFGQLDESKSERLRRALEGGRKAYDARDAPGAEAQFRIALAIAPTDSAALEGLARARKLPDVLAGMAHGKEREDEGDLDGAYKAYVDASTLDPAFTPIRASIARVGTAIEDRDYRAALSQALARLDARDFKGAEAALKNAAAIRAGTPELKDLSARVAAAAKVAALDDLRRRAGMLENQENWTAAIAAYDKALAIDGTASFAIVGRTRAESMAALYGEFDRYLADPVRLQSPEPMAHAKGILSQATARTQNGPKLREKIQRLNALIAGQDTVVPVTLRSDGQTEVTVSRVGRYGSFTTRAVELRPGSYIAVGSRSGFYDTRVEFQVIAGQKGTIVTVQCTEPINP